MGAMHVGVCAMCVGGLRCVLAWLQTLLIISFKFIQTATRRVASIRRSSKRRLMVLAYGEAIGR